MDWNDVRIFLAAARAGSVRRAAIDAKVDASTISRRLIALEHTLGTRLFHRLPHGLEPTAAGRDIMQSAIGMESAFQQLDRRGAGRDKNMFGLVRLTLPCALGELVLQGLGPYLDRHPRIELEVQTADAVMDLDARQSDVAVRVANQPPPSLIGPRIARLAGALYASTAYLAAHSAPLDTVASHRWIDWDRRYSDKPAIAWIAKRFPDRHIATRGLSTPDVLEAIRAGLGVGGLPCVLADAVPDLIRLEDAPVEASSSVWVLMHKEVRVSARVRLVGDWVAAILRAQRPRIEGRRPSQPLRY